MANLPEVKTGFLPSSPERAEHREWIGGRCHTLLSHYWREDDPIQLTAAIGRDWADVLEGLPQKFIQEACIRWMRENPDRKPKPGHIYNMARDLMPRPVVIAPRAPRESPKPARVSGDRTAEIMREVNYTPKKFGGKE